MGQKIEAKEEESPYCKVVNAGKRGWSIEVNDRKITDDLKRLNGDKLKRAFIERFNVIVNDGIFESIRREKLSSEKDRYFKSKVFNSLLPILVQAALTAFFPFSIKLLGATMVVLNYGFINAYGKLRYGTIKTIEDIAREIDPDFSPEGFFSSRTNFDNFWEYFMPSVEIDKVARAYAFLKGKGRNLVKERDPEINSG